MFVFASILIFLLLVCWKFYIAAHYYLHISPDFMSKGKECWYWYKGRSMKQWITKYVINLFFQYKYQEKYSFSTNGPGTIGYTYRKNISWFLTYKRYSTLVIDIHIKAKINKLLEEHLWERFTTMGQIGHK